MKRLSRECKHHLENKTEEEYQNRDMITNSRNNISDMKRKKNK